MRDGINTGKGQKHARKGNKGLYSRRYKKAAKKLAATCSAAEICGLQKNHSLESSSSWQLWVRAGWCTRAAPPEAALGGAAPRGLPKGTYRAGAMRLLRTAAGTQGEDLGWRRLRRAPRVILTDRHHIHSAMASPQTCHCCNTLADR